VELWQNSIELLGPWLAKVGAILIAALVLNILQRLVLWRLVRRARGEEKPWSAGILHALPSPLALLIWVCAIAWAAKIANDQLDWQSAGLIVSLASFAIIMVVTWFALRATRYVKENLLANAQVRGEQLDFTSVDAIAKFIIVVIVIIAIIFALQNFGFSVSGLLTFGGLGALAVGLAAQGMLANFFGGWMIYLTRPFSVGDWIRSPDRELQGTVEKIGWMQTRIRAFDTRPLYVPNSIFNNIIVVNPSRMVQRRIYEKLGVRHVDVKSLGKIVADVEQYLHAHEELDQTQSILVYFDEMNLNQLNFFIWCFTRSAAWVDYQRIKQDVLFKVADIIESHGAEIGEPTTTVSLAGDWPRPE
ncbi:MAG TPA: mechanosensitive ion channel family protein, partial [Gammaproteobacteria bacterium]|nr:mechanosensitive ion channel family protein [Gammaproteobacteria bacterium]